MASTAPSVPGSAAIRGTSRPVAEASILLVDDEPRILNFVSRGMSAEGFAVDVAHDGDEALRMTVAGAYDLVILDLLMPGVDGETALQRILRARPDQAVIILSCLTDAASKVRCLELGAEDYLAKPFAFDELLARVHARLRDVHRSRPTHLRAGPVTLDVVRQRADQGAGPIALTKRETLLLAELMRSAGATVSRERLLSAVWGYHFDPGSNIVDVYVRYLRAKLGGSRISTVRGEGYRFEVD